jgi:hypothetical protein
MTVSEDARSCSTRSPSHDVASPPVSAFRCSAADGGLGLVRITAQRQGRRTQGSDTGLKLDELPTASTLPSATTSWAASKHTSSWPASATTRCWRCARAGTRHPTRAARHAPTRRLDARRGSPAPGRRASVQPAVDTQVANLLVPAADRGRIPPPRRAPPVGGGHLRERANRSMSWVTGLRGQLDFFLSRPPARELIA